MSRELTMEKTGSTSNWEYGTLEDAVAKGSSNISLNKVKGDDGEYPLFSAKGFNKNISFFHQEKEYLAIIKDGAGIGRVSKHPAKSSVVATMQYLIPKEVFDIGFVQYFLNGIDFESHRQGSTIPHVYFKDYKSEPFPLLPLPQQKQIVAILDKAFSAIDTAKANAEQNLQNAKELFESYLQNVFENKGDDWEEKTLGEVCEFVQGIQRGVKLQSEICKEGQIRFLRIIDFTQGKQPPRYIDNPGDKYIMNNKDVSLVRYGASTGFVCQGKVGALANNLFRVKPKLEKELLNDFLFVFLSSGVFQNIIKASMNGAAMPAISFGLIKDIKFPIVSINEQNEIIKKIEKLKTDTKKLEAIYNQKIADLEELKKSVLQKAFSGQLNTIN